MKGSQTRKKIVDCALHQAVTHGLENLTFGSLATATQLSKSGLFAHFQSKETLQKAVLEAATERFIQEVVNPAMDKDAGLERLLALLANYLDWIAGKCSLSACPFVGFAQEFDDRPGDIKDTLAKDHVNWRRLLKSNVIAAHANGDMLRDDDPEQIVFELIGAAFAFQHTARLLNDEKSHSQAMLAFEHILGVSVAPDKR